MGDEVVNDEAVNSEVAKNDAANEPLCDGCDETFSEFLNEMAEQNAKVAACPKCGKVHGFKKTDDTQPESEQPPLKKVS
jgi:hydrogenase maturation factor HypF (carbamoyltransferase family)